MGTSTIYLKHNDLANSLDKMTKKELKELSKLSPYNEKKYFNGWNALLELHNGNVEVLVWWRGKLMRLTDAPNKLNKKYYNKYKGKELNKYEWTVLKRLILNQIEELDEVFEKQIRRKLRTNK